MHIYTTSQWLLIFFIYCFLGWIWESCYVSAKQRQWVNRGFLHGPWLPIYGSGAIIILFATLPVSNNLVLVWLFGMLAATVLEYFTGAAIEKIFKVRYWDYSSHRVQLKGYICMSSSIAWGFFSILLIRFIHPPFAKLLSHIPDIVIDPLTVVLTVLFVIDAVHSTQAALDLRNILTQLTEENENLRRLAKRTEVITAFAEDELRRFRDRTEFDKVMLQMFIKDELESQHDKHSARRKERIEKIINKGLQIKLNILAEISDVLKEKKTEYMKLHNSLDEKADEINYAMEQVQEYKHKIKERRTANYKKAMRIIHANPSASTKEFKEAMDMLKNIDKKN